MVVLVGGACGWALGVCCCMQGFPGLDGTSAFEALWEACDKSGGKAKGVVEQDQHHREYCITFDGKQGGGGRLAGGPGGGGSRAAA